MNEQSEYNMAIDTCLSCGSDDVKSYSDQPAKRQCRDCGADMKPCSTCGDGIMYVGPQDDDPDDIECQNCGVHEI